MKLGVSEFNCRSIASLVGEFGVSRHNEVLSLLARCIGQLPQLSKKVLAMYYYEKFQLDEIATVVSLTEYEVDQIRAKALGAVQAMLVARLGHERRAHNGRSSSLTKQTESHQQEEEGVR